MCSVHYLVKNNNKVGHKLPLIWIQFFVLRDLLHVGDTTCVICYICYTRLGYSDLTWNNLLLWFVQIICKPPLPEPLISMQCGDDAWVSHLLRLWNDSDFVWVIPYWFVLLPNSTLKITHRIFKHYWKTSEFQLSTLNFCLA